MAISKDTIVLKSKAGTQIEGTLAASQTPKPGQAISIKSDGLYEAWNGAANGEIDEVIILQEDANLGKLATAAYAASSPFYAWIPLPGDEINVLVTAGETVVIGSKLIITDVTGKFIVTTGVPEMEPFKAMEASGGVLAADTLIACRRV